MYYFCTKENNLLNMICNEEKHNHSRGLYERFVFCE